MINIQLFAAPANWAGQLNTNEVFSPIFNMIISQQVFADNIKGTNSQLVDAARVDGTLYGDTKLYYDTDVLKSVEWGGDSEATNLLALHRPEAPKCQALTLDVFRQISLTVDEYLSKRAFSTANAFSEFNSVMMGWIRNTKRVYDSTTYNTFIGTHETSEGKQILTIDTAAARANASSEEEANRLEGQTIAQKMAGLITQLKDVTRDFNDYGYLRSYSTDDFRFIWNSDVLEKILKIDVPTIFHNDELIAKLGEYVLPARYFGKINTATGLVADLVADGSTIRSLVEQDIQTGVNTYVHVFAGDLIPSGVTVIDISEADPILYPSYTVDDTIACKIVHKDAVPYMSAFEVGTSFFNAKSLTTNHYLTFGHNTLKHLHGKPFITVKITKPEAVVDDGE